MITEETKETEPLIEESKIEVEAPASPKPEKPKRLRIKPAPEVPHLDGSHFIYEHRRKPNPEFEGLSDIEKAKKKAAKIEEEGLTRYKKRLLAELEADKKRKLLVVNLLFALAMACVAGLYYSSDQIGFSLLD